MMRLTFNYNALPLKIFNNGHTIRVNYVHGSTMTSSNQTCELLQSHFHSPSEHTVSGNQYPMEMYFVHKTFGGTLSVVGVFFTHGEENLTMQKIWNHLPRNQTGETPIKGIVINGDDLWPENRDYYRLIDSLTTPPCSGNVKWHVFKEPIEASAKQIRAFTAIAGENTRPVQPLNNCLLVDSSKPALGGASAKSY